MEGIFKEKLPIIRESFFRLLIVNMFVVLATNINSLIDGICVGMLPGNQSLAAIGFFSPVATIITLTNALIQGSQILCGNLIGAGKRDQVDRLFFSSMLSLAMGSILGSVLIILFRLPLAGLLGADGDTRVLLANYMLGYAPGIVFQVLTSFLTGHIAYNNIIHRSYIAIGVMVAVNTVGNFVLANWFGLLGIGIASTLSFLCSFLVLMSGFLREDRALRIKLRALTQSSSFRPSSAASPWRF